MKQMFTVTKTVVDDGFFVFRIYHPHLDEHLFYRLVEKEALKNLKDQLDELLK
jgi:hypothetical protein